MMGTRIGDVVRVFIYSYTKRSSSPWGDHRHSHEKERTSCHVER